MLKSYYPHSDESTNSTRHKINKHLKDINDTISEEDIINISTTLPAQQNHINISRGIIEVMQDKSNITGNDYDNSEGKVPTEWNIIS